MTAHFAPESVMIRDVPRLLQGFRQDAASARQRLADAQRRLAQRRDSVPVIHYPDALPITQHTAEIAALLVRHPLIIVAGETGSGKTTQLPKICLAAGLGVRGLIGHTQPRRIAARAVSRRIAEELAVPLGKQVGYAVRFNDQTSDGTLIKVLTDGLLLSEINSDRDLAAYEVLIIDEAHERSLNIDFLLGYVKALQRRRGDLKLVITSATIDVASFAAHFDGAPVVEVGGRGFPVEVEYQPSDEPERDPSQQIIRAIRSIEERPWQAAQDVLVFLSGEREIHETSRFLRRELRDRFDILPLYARLPVAEQQRIFAAGARRRIVLATNVAETSLTVPNIGYVIDTGYARISRYSFRSKLQRLPVERISQASADQRMGRCGRVADGVCVRLYSQADHQSQPAYTDPEIRRTNLAAVVLQMRAFGLGRIETFPFLDPPDPRAIRDAVTLLTELGALEQDRLTADGRAMARLPIDPRLARMLLEASRQGALAELLIIASGLAVQDPRERPLEMRAAADAAHRQFTDKRSDYLAYHNLWLWHETARQELSSSALKRACQQRFLSFMRLREWRDLHRQLVLSARRLGLQINSAPANYTAVHRAIIAGSLSLLGLKDEHGSYQGARNLRFHLFPGSALMASRPNWLVCSEISETQRVYGRCAAAVEPQWIEAASAHLVKRSHVEPHWDERRGESVAFEKVSLFGLPLVERRRVSFKHIDGALAREIFVQHGLVAGAVTTRAEFLSHNLSLVREIRELEAKGRRRDLLASDDVLVAFYLERIPKDVRDLKEFERWRRRVEQDQPRLLFMNRDTVLAQLEFQLPEQAFPTMLNLGGVDFTLAYSFAPGAVDDGVSLQAPVGLLAHLRAEPLQWLVPGLLGPKCEALIRALPKALRRPLAPVPEKIDAIVERLARADVYRRGRLDRALGECVAALYGVSIALDGWRHDALPAHLCMNVQVRDGRGVLVDQDRDVVVLLERQGARVAQGIAAQHARESLEEHGLTGFPAQGVAAQRVLDGADGRLIVYPALDDRGSGVALVLAATVDQQRALSRRGYCRAALLADAATARSLRRRAASDAELGLHYAPLGSAEDLAEQLLRATAWYCFFEGQPLPESAAAFAQRIAAGRGRWGNQFNEILAQAKAILAQRFAVVRALAEATSQAYIVAVDDMSHQVQQLVPADFLDRIPLHQLAQVPRYLNAIIHRLAALHGHVERDAQQSRTITVFETRLNRVRDKLGPRDDLDELRFTLEELRVAVFAQRLGTRGKVSVKRVEQLLEHAEAEAGVR